MSLFTLEVASFKTLEIRGFQNHFFCCAVAQSHDRAGMVRRAEQIGAQRKKSCLGCSVEPAPASDGQHTDGRDEDRQSERCRAGGEFPPQV